MYISNAAAPLPAAPAPALGLLGTAVPAAVTPLVRPPFFVQNPLLVAGATPGLGAAAIGSPGLVVPPAVGAVDAIGQPSEYLLLKNMFDPTSEVSPSPFSSCPLWSCKLVWFFSSDILS